jgi:membrane fusion protein (multidrug efflux system)
MVKKTVLLAAAGAFALVLSACDKPVEQQQAQGPVPVTAVAAVSEDLPISRAFIGKVVSYDKVDIKPRIQGIIKKRAYTEGAMVKKGALLYSIEKDQYTAALQQAEAALAKAEADAINANLQLERAEQLIGTGDISKATFDNRKAAAAMAMAAVKEARAAADNAKLNLGYTDIKAPFTGRAGMSNYDEGEYITPSSGTLVSMVSIDPMGVEFAIGMKDIAAMMVSVGGEVPHISAELTLTQGHVYENKGKIDFIDNSINQQTDTLKMRARFDNPKGRLMDGELVSIKITTEEKYPMIIIPQASLQQDQAGRYVLVVKDDNKIDLRRVITGVEVGKNIVAASGLNEGEKVVVEGLQKIRQGSEVKAAIVDIYQFDNGADKTKNGSAKAGEAKTEESK